MKMLDNLTMRLGLWLIGDRQTPNEKTLSNTLNFVCPELERTKRDLIIIGKCNLTICNMYKKLAEEETRKLTGGKKKKPAKKAAKKVKQPKSKKQVYVYK